MSTDGSNKYYNLSDLTIRLTTLIQGFGGCISANMQHIQELCSNISSANAGTFLLLQFSMAQITQIGDSISNMISQINSMIGNSVRNQKQ